MDKKQFFQLVAEAKNNIATYTPEQRARIYEKIDKLSSKFMVEKVSSKSVSINENSDYLEEK